MATIEASLAQVMRETTPLRTSDSPRVVNYIAAAPHDVIGGIHLLADNVLPGVAEDVFPAEGPMEREDYLGSLALRADLIIEQYLEKGIFDRQGLSEDGLVLKTDFRELAMSMFVDQSHAELYSTIAFIVGNDGYTQAVGTISLYPGEPFPSQSLYGESIVQQLPEGTNFEVSKFGVRPNSQRMLIHQMRWVVDTASAMGADGLFICTCDEHARHYKLFGFKPNEDTKITEHPLLNGKSAIISTATIDDIVKSPGYRRYMATLPFRDQPGCYRYPMDDATMVYGTTFRRLPQDTHDMLNTPAIEYAFHQ